MSELIGLEHEIDILKRENLLLRTWAERYQWLRKHGFSITLEKPKTKEELYVWEDIADVVIDDEIDYNDRVIVKHELTKGSSVGNLNVKRASLQRNEGR